MGASTEVIVNRNIEKNTQKAFLVVVGIFFLVGFGLWIKQVTVGVSGYSAQYAWGLYIAAFLTAAAGGAGAMILACIAKFLNIMDDRNAKQYYMAAIAMFVMAGFFILADLGAPLNIFKLVFTSNFAAPMVFDFWLLMACVVICVLAVFLIGQNQALYLLGLICAVALLITESWLVASANVQELWGITMGAGTAFVQVAIMAFALLILIGQDVKYVRFGLIISLFLFLAVCLTDMLAGISEQGRLGLQWIAVAKSAVFWIGIVLGTIVPLVILINGIRVEKFTSAVIPVLAMLGVLLTKLSFIWSSQTIPAIEAGQRTTASMHIEEIVIVLGFTALGILVYYGLRARKGGHIYDENI